MSARFPVFFGCSNSDKGHYLFTADGGKGNGYCPWQDSWFDGTLNPESGREGEAAIHHIKGYTLIAFADYSVDSRPGSNVVFAIPGIMAFNAVVVEAKRLFPEVWKRFDYPIYLEVP